MKKLSYVTILLLVALLSLSACAPKNAPAGTQDGQAQPKSPDSDQGEPASVNVVVNGDMTERMTRFVQNELAEYLLNKFNVRYSIEKIPWGESPEIRFAAGEDLAGPADYRDTFYGKGYLTDITEPMQKYGQNLLTKIDPVSIQNAYIDGKMYSIPIGNKNNAGEWYQFCVRQDLLEEAGMTEITSVEDLETFYTRCKEKHPDYAGYCEGSANDLYAAAKPLALLVSDMNMVFLSGGNLVNSFVITDANANDDVVYSWLESEEFKRTAAISYRWQRLGIMTGEWLSDPTAAPAKFDAGLGMFRNGNAGRPMELFASITAANPDARLRNYRLGDTAGNPRSYSGGKSSMGFILSANVKDVNAYVKVFNDLYESQETYDFWVYGVEGVDYTLNEEGRLVGKKNDGVVFQEWAPWHVDFLRFDAAIPDYYIEDYKRWNDGAIVNRFTGFVFDTQPVMDVLAQVEAVATEYFTPIIVGLRDYDSAYPEALAKLKAAGIDTLMAAYRRQLSAWWAQNKPAQQ